MSTSKSEETHIVAIFSPKPDKVDEVRKVLNAQARAVHENEDYCLRFILTEQTNTSSPDVPDFVLFETYTSKDGVAKHSSEPHFKRLVSALGLDGQSPNILSKAPYIAHTTSIGGFEMDKKLI